MHYASWFNKNVFKGTKNLLIIDLICILGNSREPFQRKIFTDKHNEVYPSTTDWSGIIDDFSQCPHPLAGKTLTVGSLGPNPYIFTGFDRTVHYNEKGQPLGSNTGITETLGHYFGFNVTFKLLKSHDFYDERSKNWTGITVGVSINAHTLIS